MFANGDELRAACTEYFEWNDANPLMADNVFTFQGTATHEPLAKMRALTIGGLLMFLDVSRAAWRLWTDERADLLDAINWAEAVIYRQKFEGAAADMLNQAIIARELGLVDKKELSGPGGGPIALITAEMTPQEAADAYAATLNPEQG